MNRVDLYKTIQSYNLKTVEPFSELLEVTIILLSDLEKNPGDDLVVKKLDENIVQLQNSSFSQPIQVLVQAICKEVRKDIKPKWKNILNRIIKVLSEKTNQYIDNNLSEELKNLKARYLNKAIPYKQPRTRVFLSYAYDDYMYTIALYIYFLKKGVVIYVDWIRNDKLTDGQEIKSVLSKALSESEQFLFLRTVNSELNISGAKSIRQWCSWEIGNFYSISTSEKYFINLHDVEPEKNQMLHGFKKLESIKDGKLVGRKLK